MTTTITLRSAQEDDAAALAVLGRQTFIETFGKLYKPADLNAYLDGTYAPELQLQEIRCPETRMQVVEEAGRLIAFCKSAPCYLPLKDKPDNSWQIHRIYVLAEYKGKGIGQALLADALHYFRDKSATAVYVGVWSGNHAAQAFYRRAGFEKWAEYRFPVGDQVDDEWIMRLMDWSG